MVKLVWKNSNLCDHNSPTSQTDRQTTCDRNTALCTKVHRAVIKVLHQEEGSRKLLAEFPNKAFELIPVLVLPNDKKYHNTGNAVH